VKKIVLFAQTADHKTLVRISDDDFALETWLTPEELDHLLSQGERAKRKLQLLKEGS
jgi:hypothetical protein